MFKLNQKSFLIAKPTIYDLRANIPPEKRLELLKRITYYRPNVVIKAGTTDTNPYKEHYDVILADRREALQKYQDSILWSPRYTPTYVQMPKRMLELKKKGYQFPQLEAKGYLDGWEEKEVDETDWTFKEMNRYESKMAQNKQKSNTQEHVRNQRQQEYHDKMQNKFSEIYEMKNKTK